MRTKINRSPVVILLFVLLASIYSCQTNKNIVSNTDTTEAVDDSTKYEMIVFDSGFETWFVRYQSQISQRSLSYYKNWNEQYVRAWNNKTMSARYGSKLGGPIDYDFTENYPIEIEHKLFYYFQYVQNEIGIPLLRNSPRLSY